MDATTTDDNPETPLLRATADLSDLLHLNYDPGSSASPTGETQPGQPLTFFDDYSVENGVPTIAIKASSRDMKFIACAFSHDRSYFVTVQLSGLIKLWNVEANFSPLGLSYIPINGCSVEDLVFSPTDSKKIVYSLNTGDVYLGDVGSIVRRNSTGFSSEDSLPFIDTQPLHLMDYQAAFVHHAVKLSSDGSIVVLIDKDGATSAVQIHEGQPARRISLVGHSPYEVKPVVSIHGNNVLVTYSVSTNFAVGDFKLLTTVIWTNLDFSVVDMKYEGRQFRGEGCWEKRGHYLIIWELDSLRKYKVMVYLTEHFHTKSRNKQGPIAVRSFDCCFIKKKHNGKRPLIALHQVSSSGNRLLFWDTTVDEICHEIDLTLHKDGEDKTATQVSYCFSKDKKWIGVCSITTKMLGLISTTSGVFVWTSCLAQLDKKDASFRGICFDPSETKLMVDLTNAFYLFAPSCVCPLLQVPPEHKLIQAELGSDIIDLTEAFRDVRKTPKQVIFSLLSTEKSIMSKTLRYLLDVVICFHFFKLAIVCQTFSSEYYLVFLDYHGLTSKELRSLLYCCVLGYKELTCLAFALNIDRERGEGGVSVFCFNDTNYAEKEVILFAQHNGLEILCLPEHSSNYSPAWTKLATEKCFGIKQLKDQPFVTCLLSKKVLIVDVRTKKIIRDVNYTVDLTNWWEYVFQHCNLFAFYAYDQLDITKLTLERKIFLQDRLRGLFDVTLDGQKILLGWDTKHNRSLWLTPCMTDDELRTLCEEARDGLCQCSMLTGDGKWVAFVESHKLKDGNLVVCLADSESKQTIHCLLLNAHSVNKSGPTRRSLWLEAGLDCGSRDYIKGKLPCCNLFVVFDNNGSNLTVVEVSPCDEGIGIEYKQVFQITPYTDEKCVPLHDHSSIFKHTVSPRSCAKMTERYGPAFLNMMTDGKTNFQYVIENEKEKTLLALTAVALEYKIPVSGICAPLSGRSEPPRTLLDSAIDKKSHQSVKTCLHFIEEGLFTFSCAASMMKDCFFELLSSYNDLLLPLVRQNCLTIPVATIEVPVELFHKSSNEAAILGTSNTVLEWRQELDENRLSKYWYNEHNTQEQSIYSGGNKSRIKATVSFFCMEDVCKIGLNGIIRFLLIQKAPSYIFKTDIVKWTIQWKWENIWKKKCLIQFGTYGIFLLIFSIYAVGVGLCGDRLEHDMWAKVGISLPLLVCMAMALQMTLQELHQLDTFKRNGKELFQDQLWGFRYYFLRFGWDVLELVSYIMILFIIPIVHISYVIFDKYRRLFYVAIGVEAMLVWIKVWYFAQPFEQTGALVLMIGNVIQDCIPFLGLAFVILVGFSMSLYILFQPVLRSHRSEGGSIPDEVHQLTDESFGSPLHALSTLFYAMVGTFDPSVYYHGGPYSWLIISIFIFYMSLQMVVLLNMIIAVMGDTFDRVKNTEQEQIFIGRARFIDACEASLKPREIEKIEKRIGKYLYVLTPLGDDSDMRSTKWTGKINIIEANLNNTIKESEKSMKKNFHQMLRSITKENREFTLELFTKMMEKHKEQGNALMESFQQKLDSALGANSDQLSLLMSQVLEQQQEETSGQFISSHSRDA